MTKNIFLLLVSLCFSIAAFSQPMSAGNIWSADGNSYTILEKTKIVKVELPSMNKTTLVDGEKLFPKDSLNPRQISSFQWSFDMGKALLFVNTETLYHKTTGEVWLYDMKTSALIQLGKTLRQNGLMYAKFSPDASQVAYVYQDKSDNKVV